MNEKSPNSDKGHYSTIVPLLFVLYYALAVVSHTTKAVGCDRGTQKGVKGRGGGYILKGHVLH